MCSSDLTHIFRQGGGERIAAELDLPMLGSLPLDPAVVVSGDEGEPIVLRDPTSIGARAFFGVARAVSARIREENARNADAGEADLNLKW